METTVLSRYANSALMCTMRKIGQLEIVNVRARDDSCARHVILVSGPQEARGHGRRCSYMYHSGLRSKQRQQPGQRESTNEVHLHRGHESILSDVHVARACRMNQRVQAAPLAKQLVNKALHAGKGGQIHVVRMHSRTCTLRSSERCKSLQAETRRQARMSEAFASCRALTVSVAMLPSAPMNSTLRWLRSYSAQTSEAVVVDRHERDQCVCPLSGHSVIWTLCLYLSDQTISRMH
jgi:hypothetical protein